MFNDSGSDGEYGGSKKSKRRGAGGGSRRTGGGGGGRAQRNAGGVRARHNIVTAYNPDTQALVRRRVRVNDPDEIVQIRVPNAPIPLPWGRVVKPYLPRELRGAKKYAVAPVPAREEPHPTKYVEIDFLASLQTKNLDDLTYQAAVINPGWEKDNAADALSALSKIPLPKLVPTGFIFIWTPKQHVQAVCKQMTKWGYIYIENLTWVYMGSNNSVLKLPSEFVCNSHMTLYMFRVADKGRDIELRHQRNPDVTFECLPATFGGNCGPASAPEETFVAVETLLPTGKGQLLELWAPQGVTRPGWTHVVEVGQNES
jgi:N6-adenosine-specific RNA methylase IME4